MSGSPELILLNGQVLTLDHGNSIAEAVVVKNSLIVNIGSSLEMEKSKGEDTLIIDLKGRTLMPGFIDAHCHAGIYGTAKGQISCSGEDVLSIRDIVEKIRKKAGETPIGQWILSRGYKEFELEEKRHPTRWDLDKATSDHKVFMMRTCGHVAVVNSRVLRELGINKNSPDPDGGRYERDSSGEPNGILLERAATAVRMLARPSENEIYRGLQVLNTDFLKLGITSVHDASGLFAEEIRQFQKAVSDDTLQLSVYLMFRFSGGANRLGEQLLDTGIVTGFGNKRIKVGPYKLMLDGAGSTGTAAMFSPPPGKPGESGILYFDQDELNQRLLKAHRAGYQIAVHAIGNRALLMVIEALEKILKQYPKNDHRHRIEHFGFASDAAIQRVKQLKIIPILGLPFLYELGDQYLSNYGEDLMAQAYPLKRLIDSQVPAAMSSDAPVISPNPFHGIHFALNRKTKSGQVISAEQKVGLLETLKTYTLNGAFASFDERSRGSIEVGKNADMIILSENVCKTPPEEILRTEVDMTIIDGKVVFKR